MRDLSVPARPLYALILLVPLLIGCPRQEDPGSGPVEEALEIEDVAMPVDVELSTDADMKGPPIVQGVSGVLPSDYPRGLPTYEPSSVSDFGAGPDGTSFVELESPSPVSAVTASLERRLQAAGWHLETSSAGRFRASKDGTRVSIAVSDLYSGSRIRIEY